MSTPTSFVRLALLSGAVLLAGCEGMLPRADDPTVCNQTYEFGNYGCARLVVVVEGPPQPWPVGPRWDVRAVSAREGTGANDAFAARPGPGATPLRLIRYDQPAPGSGDTASVWVTAKMLEHVQAVGVPFPVFAADSVLHVARFAPVGGRAPEDTVRLTLKKR